VWNALLQILDDGRLTDGQGRTVDFRNTVIIMTSNVGTRFFKQSGAIGFSGMREAISDASEALKDDLKRTFRPEFINRIDEVIVFASLTVEHMERIVDLQMKEIQDRLADQGLTVSVSGEARTWLANEGYEEQFGARPLRRALQRHVESPLSVQLLQGEFSTGDHVLIDEEDGRLTFQRVETEEAEPVPSAT
jgi:ATP-dependent Clp protease ATP-binding subunit ClpC